MTAATGSRTHHRILASSAVVAVSVVGIGLTGVVTAAQSFADPLPANCAGTTTITCTFSYDGPDGSNGADKIWIVPTGVTSAYFDLLGAQGADSNDISGGRGGETSGFVTLTPGSVVGIVPGGQPTVAGHGMGGFNGGGSAGASGLSAAGGGATDVRLGSFDLSSRVLVAGGGGGAASECFDPQCSVPGAGGGTSGLPGSSSPHSASAGGEGGSQTGPGLTPLPGNGARGGPGVVSGDMTEAAGAGGGGFFGGAGGNFTYPPGISSTPNGIGAGGGGSSFVHPDPTKVRSGLTVAGVNEGNGLVTVTYTAPKSDQAISFPPLPDRRLSDSPFTISGVTGGASGNPVTFTAAGPCSVAGTQVTLSDVGLCTITAHQAGNANYNDAPDVARSFNITNVPAPPSLSISDARTVEGNSGTHVMQFPVRLSAASSQQVTVHWATADGTAHAPADYAAASGTLTFSPGQTSKSIPVTIKGDRTREGNETVRVNLTNPRNATTADARGIGTIGNDD